MTMRPVLVAKGEDPTVELPPITQWEDEALITDALQQLSATLTSEMYQRKVCRELVLSERALNRLIRYDILTIGQLVTYSRTRLLNLPLVGVKVVAEIEAALAGLGLRLASDHE
jgi:DNA-directed RNA polymerase alpha subunit